METSLAVNSSMDKRSGRLRLLSLIASYGTKNEDYLTRLIDEYRSMSYSTDIVVLSDIPKCVGNGVRVVVGLPSKNPWSLPFGHKQIFAENLNRYDLFVYSEDDTLITQKNIEAFLKVSELLTETEIAGFLRFEKDKDGRNSYPDVHFGFHWDPHSIRSRGSYTFAYFTNEHAAAYVLTQEQLRRAIASGGFLVPPHEGKYDMICTAGTDPYTQCGFEKLICVSDLSDFLIHHLPNKYVGKMGLDANRFDSQIKALLKIADEQEPAHSLLNSGFKFELLHFGKNYYEPTREDLIRLVPSSANSILSIGCGWGATEERLARNGKRVVAIPLDDVITACSQFPGVEIIRGDFDSALARLRNERFDCLLISNILQLVEDPSGMLASCGALLSDPAVVITVAPNTVRLPELWRRARGPYSGRLGNFSQCGVQRASHKTIGKWLKRAGFKVEGFVDVLPPRWQTLDRLSFGLMRRMLSSEIIVSATRRRHCVQPIGQCFS